MLAGYSYQERTVDVICIRNYAGYSVVLQNCLLCLRLQLICANTWAIEGHCRQAPQVALCDVGRPGGHGNKGKNKCWAALGKQLGNML